MKTERHILLTLAALAGLTWMAAVLLIAANPKGTDLAGDLAYDRANRVHTLALVVLLVTMFVIYRMIRTRGVAGARAAGTLILAAVLMLVGNVVAFWGVLLTGGTAEEFWGGFVGWIIFLPGMVLLLVGFITLARAARHWPDITKAHRWAIGLTGFLLSLTTGTWAISAAVTLAPALLALFALFVTATAVADAADAPRGASTVATGQATHSAR